MRKLVEKGAPRVEASAVERRWRIRTMQVFCESEMSETIASTSDETHRVGIPTAGGEMNKVVFEAGVAGLRAD